MTFQEIISLWDDAEWLRRIGFAALVKTELIADDVNATANQKTWSKRVFTANPTVSAEVWHALLVDVRTLTVRQIEDLTDPQVQTGVNTIVDRYLAKDYWLS